MNELSKRIIISLMLFLLLFFSIFNNYILIIILIIILHQSIYEFYNMFKKIFNKEKKLVFFNLLIVNFYLFYIILLIALPFINNIQSQEINILLILSICISSDIGGFIFGKILKGKKLTKISPNKTYSGVFGSYILSLITSFIFFSSLIPNEDLIIFSILISSISQIGDLIISLMKRKAFIKNTGSILPGHGGILDRIDGLLFSLPIGLIIIPII
tara:strand:+ start:2856 stop:3500 length:645 start_codon:yes stop_codon:yes gene_type:complete